MAPSDQQLKAIFKAYDSDGSGKITVEELATALNKKGGKNLEGSWLCGCVSRVSQAYAENPRMGVE